MVCGGKPVCVITNSVTTRSTFCCLSDVEIDVFLCVCVGGLFSQTRAILDIYLALTGYRRFMRLSGKHVDGEPAPAPNVLIIRAASV